MEKRLSFSIIGGLGTLLFLLPLKAQADFIIEFTDGRQVTVGQYVDEGRTIKIYTPQGAIGFRKDDVKRISEVGVNQGTGTALETVTVRSAVPTPTSTPGPAKGKGSAEAAGKTDKAGQGKTAGESKLTGADLERMGERYQDVSQTYNEAWKKHSQDVHSGASDEVLTENRHRLMELDQERKALKKEIRQANPDSLPPWVR